MATAAELARPGVEVYQKVRAKSPTFLRPTLAPVVVGPAFEVIDVLTADGTLNPKAKYGTYAQIDKVITQSAFPDPRGNIDELSIQLGSVKPYMLTGGKLNALPMNPGTGFLAASHVATKARFTVTGVSFAVQGQNLVMAVDQPINASPAKDVTVAFTGAGALTAAQVVAAINTAFGMTIAEVTVDGGGAPTGFTITSPTYGALSSLTIRDSGSANQLLTLGWGTSAEEHRIEGAGYRAYNLGNNSTTSTFVEFFRGDYLVNRVSVADGAWGAGASHIQVLTGTSRTTRATAITFGDSNTIPVLAGDIMIADGIVVGGGEISNVDSTRFRLGTINPLLSTADSSGNYLSKIYDNLSLGITTLDSTPFAPVYVWFKATGLQPNVAATAAKLTMTNTGTAAAAAQVEGTADVVFGGGLNLDGLTLDYTVTVDGVETTDTFTFAAGTLNDMAGLLAAISIPGVSATDNAGTLRLQTAKAGLAQGISILATGTANSALHFSTSTATSDLGADPYITNLANTSLSFTLDYGAHVYSVTFLSTSLVEAVAAINSMAGAAIASLDSNGTKVILTSRLSGVGSNITVTSANAILGFALNATNTGTKRPNPDVYIDQSGNLVVSANLIRDPVTGYPLDQTTSPATLYVQFKALRLDVSPAAQVSGVLRLPDIDTLTSVLDPVDVTNPGALGAYLAMLNCPTFEVKFLGVDEVSGTSPEGTELAYARAAAMLEAEEVYAIAPLTQSEVVHQLFNTHVTLMSEPEQGGERILLFNKKMPVRRTSKSAASGTGALSTGTLNQLQVDVTPQQGLIDAGVNPALPFTVAMGVYVEFSWQGSFYRYNVKSVTGGLVNLNRTFATGENDDLFYSTVAVPTGLASLSWAMKVRGASLTIPGSSPAKLDYSLVATTVAEGNAGYGNRRAFSFFPENVKTTLKGISKEIPGYYACAAVAGMIAGLPPAQGFTNYPITGLTGVAGTGPADSKFTRRQLNQMAGGGTYILQQEVENGPVFSRHQLSTDTTSIETRELSITKVVDFTAKFLRAGVRRFIGRQNINAVFLDTVGTTITGMLQFLVEHGILNGFHLNNIIQDAANPDTVMLDVTLDVPFPCNYIKLTLVL